MIKEANSNNNNDIIFEGSSENIDDSHGKFDVIFCSSTFNGLKSHGVNAKFYSVLKPNGRVGIQHLLKEFLSIIHEWY